MNRELMEKDLKEFEKTLLPEGCHFSEEQINVIRSNQSANVVAGPGSGKTTVLIAKIALIFKNMKREARSINKGLCIITHTNVAVDEIRNKLKIMGIEEIKHPHFIGTIHDFFNHFLTYTSFQKLYPGRNAIIYDEEIYKESFKSLFNQYKPNAYTGNPPTSKISQTYLDLSEDNDIDIIGEAPNFYKGALLETFKTLINTGVLRFNDTLSFSKWFIEKYNSKIRKAFENRFSWIFLDETQDTSYFQYELLNNVFKNSSCIFQKYGDPYQSLYTMFGVTEDAWKPFNEDVGYVELSYSTRFGENIARVLRTTCVEEYKTLRGNVDMKSYKPHMIFYDSKDNVINAFLEIVNTFARDDSEFRKTPKKVGVVGLRHDEVLTYYTNYQRSSDVKANTETIIKSYYELIVKGLFYYTKYLDYVETNYSIKNIKDIISKEQNLYIKSSVAKLVKNIAFNEGDLTEEYNKDLRNIFLNFIKIEQLESNAEALERMILYLQDRYIKIHRSFTSNSEVILKEQLKKDSYSITDIKFGTVHSVKGETHKATMLLESEIVKGPFSGNPEVYYDCTEIFDFLIGNNYDYKKETSNRYNVIKDALKTGFVALSRPTHLAVVAINKNNFGDNYETKKELAVNAGWEVIEVD